MHDSFALESFLPFRLNRLASEVSERMAAIYAEKFGLDIPQWRVLATLSGGADITAQNIVASTRTHKSTISRAVQELEARGLVERAVSTADRRANALRLTAAGRKLFARMQPLVLAYQEALLAALEPAESKALLRGLQALERTLALTTGEGA